MKYIDFTSNDSGYIMIRIKDVRKKGPCRILSNLRHVNADDETVYTVDNALPVTSAQFLSVVGF